MNARRFLLVAALVGLIGARASAAPPAKVALQGGRIIPVAGQEIPQGTVLIENGTITAIGQDVKVPYDAMVVDVTGKVLFPGLVWAHTSEGLDRANENLSVTPYLDVYDAIDPSSLDFENALRDGLLAVHVMQGNSCVIGGLSRLVHPIGRTPDEMTIRPALALKMSTSPKSGYDRMSQLAELRSTFVELEEYLENLAEKRYEAQLKEQEKEIEVTPDEARKRGRELIRDQDCDDKHRNLFKLIDGRLDAWIYCGSATDVAPAVQVAKENGFLERTTFVLGTDAYRAVEELKKAERPVVLAADLVHQERHPITGELRETFIPTIFHKAGIPFALLPNSSGSLGERYLTYQAARCVREGIPRQAALQAITLNPARMLGVADRLGSLAVGKSAYVLVLSGDPLDFDTWIDKAYIRGVLAYDRDEDVRLKKLLGVEERLAEQAEAQAAQAAKKEPAAKPAKKPAAKAEKKPAPKKKDQQEARQPAEKAEKKVPQKKQPVPPAMLSGR